MRIFSLHNMGITDLLCIYREKCELHQVCLGKLFMDYNGKEVHFLKVKSTVSSYLPENCQ